MIHYKQFICIFQALLFALFIEAQPKVAEITYLHTDRTIYTAGETVFYKLYVLENATRKLSNISKIGYIVLRDSNSSPSIKIRVKISNGFATGSINLPDTLSSGSYQFVSFTANMRNFGESNFNYSTITIISSFDKKYEFKLPNYSETDTSATSDSLISINIDKKQFEMREKIAVKISSKIKAFASVSVFETVQAKHNQMPTIKSIEKLSTQKSFNSTNTLFLPEVKGKILRGFVIDSTTQKPVKDAVVLLSCIDTIPNLQYAVTSTNGLFQFLLSDYYDSKKLFLTIKDVPESNTWKISMEDEFGLSKSWHPDYVDSTINQDDFFKKCQNIAYINKVYKPLRNTSEILSHNKEIICPRFYNCNVPTTKPADYESLKDFFEIAIELLPELRIVKESDKFHIQLFNSYFRQFETLSPAIFLDGVYVDNINKILVLGSELIKKIDILSEKRAFGDLIFGGMVSISTIAPEIVNNIISSNSLKIQNFSYIPEEVFEAYIPNKSLKNNDLYLKQLLYWNPTLELSDKSDCELNFYASDNIGTFTIQIVGISDSGIPIDENINIELTFRRS